MPTRDLSVKRIRSPGLKQLSSVISPSHMDALEESKRTCKIFQDMFESLRAEKEKMVTKIMDAYAKNW